MKNVVRQTYNWLTTAFGSVPTLDDKLMVDKMKLIGKLLIEEVTEYQHAETRDDKINAISDLLFVVNNMPFFLGESVEWATNEFENVTVNYPRPFYADVFIDMINDIFIDNNHMSLNKSVARVDYIACVHSIKNLIIDSGFTEYEIEVENERVFKSNMTKFCKTLDEAKQSVEMYAYGTHPNKPNEIIETIYMDTGNAEYPYRIQTTEGKIMKSHLFLDVDNF